MPDPKPSEREPTLSQVLWRRFCVLAVRVFYRRFEVTGLENLPSSGPLILCANHVNALVDAVVVQAACPRPVHPIARSGLFRNPLLRPILALIQAIPVYRRHEKAIRGKPPSNEDSFRRCHEILSAGGAILIFPEGQSHSDPSLRPLKTGAARLAFGHRQREGGLPEVVPVGLTFTAKGRFRAGALVQVGEPVEWRPEEGDLEEGELGATPEDEEAVRRYTEEIDEGLKAVTINVDSWEDLALMRLMQRFFALRAVDPEPGVPQDVHRPRTLADRFRSFQRLDEAHRALRRVFPEFTARLRHDLTRFDRLRRRYRIRDYQLELRYTPAMVLRWLLSNLAFLLFVVPLAAWGILHSGIPYFLTRTASRLSARARDHYDTAGMLWGLVFFGLFWGAQTFAVFYLWGLWPAVAYGISLPITAGVALKVGYERRRIFEEARVFWLFLRRRDLQDFLRGLRDDLEDDLEEATRRVAEARKRLAP